MSDASEKVYRIPPISWSKSACGGLFSDTIFGRIYLAHRTDGWSFYRPFGQSPDAARMTEAEAKRFAQAWYVERMAQGLEEVGTTNDAEAIKRLNARIEEDKWKIIGLTNEAARERMFGEREKAEKERMNLAWERAVNNAANDQKELRDEVVRLKKILDDPQTLTDEQYGRLTKALGEDATNE
jgi:hypothetical protein